MRWDAVEVARFARGAGFAGDDVKVATAVALATSGGVSDFDHLIGSPGVGRLVGLWGLDIDRWPEYASHDLTAPQRAASAAYDLVRRTGGWAWAPAYGTSYYHAVTAHAGTSRTREMHHQVPTEPFTLHQTHNHVHSALRDLAGVRAMLGAFIRPTR